MILAAGVLLTVIVAAQPQRRVIVDTDAGADDLLAILFLLDRPEVKIEAITIVNGLAHTQAGAESVLRLLAYQGHKDIPVYIGASQPMSGRAEFPAEWRAASDGLLRAQTPAADSRPRKEDAMTFLSRRLRKGPPVDVLALGPLTNFALTFRQEPRLGSVIREFVWMGGALNVPGNVEAAPRAEWNAYVDPLAAETVLGAGWPLKIVGLDASSQVAFRIEQLEQLEALRLTKSAWLAVEILRSEADSIQAGRYFAWDPLAAVALVAPKVVRTENVSLGVRKRAPERGRLIRVPALKPNAAVAVSANPDLFDALFWRTFIGLSKL